MRHHAQRSEVKSLREARPKSPKATPASTTRNCGCTRCTFPVGLRHGFGSHDPDRRRKLLAHRHELDQWQHETRTEPLTMCRSSCTSRTASQVELALAKGKKSQDRRQAIAKRDADRDIARAIRHTEKYT